MKPSTRISTLELTGQALDWATATALGFEPRLQGSDDHTCGYVVIAIFKRSRSGMASLFGPFEPSTDWAAAGPLLQSHSITVSACEEVGQPSSQASSAALAGVTYGDGYLEAGLRHLVRTRLGSRADIPNLLLADTAFEPSRDVSAETAPVRQPLPA